MAVAVTQLGDRVDPSDIEHVKPSALDGDVDLSAEIGTWKRYLWDSFDRSPEVRFQSKNSRADGLVNGYPGTTPSVQA
jgi:hypothetical protein